MARIIFPKPYDNETAHRELKLLMMQHKQLDIKVENEEVLISCQGVTGLRYLLNENSWNWILDYLKTGDYEDFGVSPSAVSLMVNDGYQESKARELVDQGYNVAPIPFHRETETYIRLRVLFKFGKLLFGIRRSDEFINYLIEQKIW